jgi:hypothetical protein
MMPRIPGRRPPEPRLTLTFSPLAWLKLQYFCHAGPTEIGGFGVAAPNNPLYVEEFVTVRQQVSPASVHFADDAVADYFDACVDRGLKPESFGRIWLHTHPGDSVTPSSTDEATFSRCFGRCDWSMMFILGRTSRTNARLAIRFGPGVDFPIATTVDWSDWPLALASLDGSQERLLECWRQEYTAHIQPIPQPEPVGSARLLESFFGAEEAWNDYPWLLESDDIFCDPKEEYRHGPTNQLRTE